MPMFCLLTLHTHTQPGEMPKFTANRGRESGQGQDCGRIPEASASLTKQQEHRLVCQSIYEVSFGPRNFINFGS